MVAAFQWFKNHLIYVLEPLKCDDVDCNSMTFDTMEALVAHYRNNHHHSAYYINNILQTIISKYVEK